jgi:hypothetical protein
LQDGVALGGSAVAVDEFLLLLRLEQEGAQVLANLLDVLAEDGVGGGSG